MFSEHQFCLFVRLHYIWSSRANSTILNSRRHENRKNGCCRIAETRSVSLYISVSGNQIHLGKIAHLMANINCLNSQGGLLKSSRVRLDCLPQFFSRRLRISAGFLGLSGVLLEIVPLYKDSRIIETQVFALHTVA